MIASVLIMITLGGSVVTTTVPPPFATLQNPDLLTATHDPGALAAYYNTTLTRIGDGEYASASLLLRTFSFVNVAPGVNATAQAANADLSVLNATAANATSYFQLAEGAARSNEYVNATLFTDSGCALAAQANASLADFQGPQTSRLRSESVPVGEYSRGAGVAASLVSSLLAQCSSLRRQVNFAGLDLVIGSPQSAVETGGELALFGNLTLDGAPVGGGAVLFYLNGTYFGSLTTSAAGTLSGTLTIPYIYSSAAYVQGLVLPSSGEGGATSNRVPLRILFNGTSIVIGDPPSVLPTFSFGVQGNLTTVGGAPLPGAPVKLTFFNQSQVVRTDPAGVFAATLTVPANATDGVHYVYASFAPQGVFGPSVNFTSVRVVHLPMYISVNAPSLTPAGFTMSVSGTASANGSALAGAVVRVASPWGSVLATTDASGYYHARIRVSAYEFAFSRDVVVSAVSMPPYIAPAAAAKSVGLFNILLVTLPAALVGIVGYEADKLGVFAGARKKRGPATVMEEAATLEVFSELESEQEANELIRIYLRSLRLASAKLHVGFRRSQTLREAVATVAPRGTGVGFERFASILMAVEDYAYGASFDQGRVEEAKEWLGDLEREWG